MPALIAQPGMPIWIDLATTDLSAAKAFYSDVLGWEFPDPAADASGASDLYALAKKDGMPVAGVAQVPQDSSAMWGLMLYTPDVAQAHSQAVAAGATSVLEPQEMADGAAMAIVVDPCGAAIGLKRPADEIALFAAGEPGTPVWHELLVGRNWEATLDFYHQLAGWDIRGIGGADDDAAGSAQDADAAGGAGEQDADAAGGAGEQGQPRYAVGEYEGAALVGMWDTSALVAATGDEQQTFSMWTLTLGVPVGSLAETLEKVERGGGQVVRQPFMAEFGLMASFTDPQGALVNVCEVEDYVPSEDEVHEPDLFAPEDFRAN